MGKPTYILIIRHGESEGNCDKSVNRTTPNHLVPLTKKGHEQSERAGDLLVNFVHHKALINANPKRAKKSILFYTSPYLRTRQTCFNLIEKIKNEGDIQYTVQEETRMREQDFGNFQSSGSEMDRIWKERASYGHFFYRIPHGESAADVYDRVASFNESLYRQFRNEDFPNILVLVTHGIWSRVFLMKWFKWTYEEFESLTNIPHCKYIIMKIDPKTQKYHLLTKLDTWDDVSDDELRSEILKDLKENELNTNTDSFINHSNNADEIEMIISAQKSNIDFNKEKNKKIEEMYNQVHNKIHEPEPNRKFNNGETNKTSGGHNDSINPNDTEFRDRLISKFKVDNQSVCNSVESLENWKSN
ncbi:uncharacterized protein KGF55_005489 [Candida pseudojiufengensis]|uniref:uncharacterized protein n=1 Tax=Candida pseudojiufengensis TaxID=497109 RepID=UPI0022241933|nr:uncharacterized protein KGF55_005489 [Candida pseudojiufengensis]KAI5959146.1 hypothetical protein KGF55_005489 [Candida pseudojiufengensis]